MTLDQTIAAIEPIDNRAQELAWRRWDSIAKPLRSLGLLEEAVARIAGITGSAQLDIAKRCVVVFCADNGVVAEGITQTSGEVTAIVTENFASGDTSVCVMAQVAEAKVIPVDMGVARDMNVAGIIHRKIAYGTRNFAIEPAMSRAQAVQALEIGIDLARDFSQEGYRLFATGEMGIGNTTTSSALAAVLLDKPVQEVTGRGAGLSTPALGRKVQTIERAIELHRPCSRDPIDVLSKLGGFDLAGMAGFYLGAAASHVPVLVDGFISAVAALVAQRICPLVSQYCIASHVSKEPAGELLMRELGLHPFLTAGMSLGEGTGAVAAIPILDMAVGVYRQMSTFTDIQIDSYQPLC